MDGHVCFVLDLMLSRVITLVMLMNLALSSRGDIEITSHLLRRYFLEAIENYLPSLLERSINPVVNCVSFPTIASIKDDLMLTSRKSDGLLLVIQLET